jgi:putative Holliday junction resolvase
VNQEYRILAIDYGSVRIGIAISDPMRIIAKPLCTIANTGEDEVLAAISALIEEHSAGMLLLGIPYALDGSITAKTEETLTFKNVLIESLTIPVLEWNETLSTVEANRALKTMGYDWKKARTMIDAMAACMILKSYLESN